MLEKYNDLSLEKQQELEEDIESIVVEGFFLPKQQEIVAFFEKVLSLDESVQLVKYPEKLEVIDMYYYANCPLGYLMIQPSVEFCHPSNFISETTLSLEHYSYEDIDGIALQMMMANNIDLEEFGGEEDFEYPLDTLIDLERKFLVACWNEAKKKYPLSKIKAFGMASDGSGFTFDIDNGARVEEKEGNPVMEEYLSSINIFPTKDLLSPSV
ncbi:MAG: hypothetical protein ACI94Y_001906 [Maribacter sp.]|jgi:hypothetical protein